ncbi:diiron oxygenase [Actinokineospora inagensis]|uniref:diiron oxygenase n=1 Tax=Actinokineospora inagensis TaxID=103730 RepID=UPI00041C93D3|nr:diiron oxygenase [Actinokineospora inagensis]
MNAPFSTWYDTSGVRSGVRRLFHDETDQGKVFYPAQHVPHLSHEVVVALPAAQRRDLAIRHLYQFLLSTTHLETRVVNPAAELIANGRSGVDLTGRHRLDAFKVYCDEGYHALYSLDLADQVARETGVPIPDWDFGGFVDALAAAGARTLPEAPALVPLLQAVVFETLVTAVLNEIPNDPTVLTVVRDLTRDHARDEGHHHRFFADFFQHLWAGLDRSLRGPVARALPALVRACLDWDTAPVLGALRLAGLDTATATAVVTDSYLSGAGEDRVATICRATVRVFRAAGVFDVPGAHEAFAAHGLVATGKETP